MFLLKKKRIYFILTCLLISTFIYQILVLKLENKETKEKQSIATVALPVNNKTIILDARPWGRRWWCYKFKWHIRG